MCDVTGFFDHVMFLQSPRKSVIFLNLETCAYESEAHFRNMSFWKQYLYRNDPRYKWLYNAKPGFEAYYLRNKSGTMPAPPVQDMEAATATPANLESVEPIVIPVELLASEPKAGSMPGWVKNIAIVSGFAIAAFVVYKLMRKKTK